MALTTKKEQNLLPRQHPIINSRTTETPPPIEELELPVSLLMTPGVKLLHRSHTGSHPYTQVGCFTCYAGHHCCILYSLLPTHPSVFNNIIITSVVISVSFYICVYIRYICVFG